MTYLFEALGNISLTEPLAQSLCPDPLTSCSNVAFWLLLLPQSFSYPEKRFIYCTIKKNRQNG